jgi:hypothetical protein
MMVKTTEFDDIRPYYDEEIAPAIARLLDDPQFNKVLSFVVPADRLEEKKALLRTFTNCTDFQVHFILDVVFGLTDKTAASVECTGFENIHKAVPYTFISNHRDIVLDAAILSVLLKRNGYETTEIAIGDNLLLSPWIEDAVKLNKSFIVKRGVSIRQMLEVSSHLSKYIHYAVKEKKESVWIAQREGRAKDSNDKTQESLLKMLAIGGESNFLSNLKALNILPTSLSYEFDPCDYLKAQEYQLKRDNPDYKKTPADDFVNMQTGMFGFKGRIHFQLGQPLNRRLHALDAKIPKSELVTEIATLIDQEIYRNYFFYPTNYIAYDRLWGNGSLKDRYQATDEQAFDLRLADQLEKIDLPTKDIPFLTEKLLEMYAYPVKNHLEAL